MANSYPKNKLVRLTGTFTSGGANADPTTITLKVETPAGVETAYTYALAQLIKSATGVYYRDVTLNQSGNWIYVFIGTGAVDVYSDDTYIYVKDSVFP